MQKLPKHISTTQELEEVLTLPSEALIDFVAGLKGDIMILGAGGKMGPTITRMAKRAVDAAGVKKEVIAVGRRPLPKMEADGIKTVFCDLLDDEAVKSLPRVENIIFMAGRKFGSTGSEWLTWAANAIVPYHVASVFIDSRIVVFSTGCVYPVVHIDTGGSVETDLPAPIGEYSQSCLGRERMFDYFSAEQGEKVVQIRLYYAQDLRYGVLVDIATKVFKSEPVDVTTGYFNAIWQGDACEQILRSLDYASSPSAIFNIAGPEIISVYEMARKFGELFGKEAIISGESNGFAYMANASKAVSTFGKPSVPLDKMTEWVAYWIKSGGEDIGKPTHFEVQDGKY